MQGHLPAGPEPDGVDTFQTELDLDVGRVRVTGELDRDTAHHLLDAFLALDRTDHLTWTVDLTGITFCDVEGLRVLCHGHDLAVDRGRLLRLLNATPLLRRLMRLCGMSFLTENGAAPTRSLANDDRPAATRRLRTPVCEGNSSWRE